MADKTTLEIAAEFFDKHGWPGRLRYIAGWHWYLCHHYSDTSVYAQLNDDEATAIIEKHLWEILCKDATPIDYPQRGHDINGFVLVIQPGKSIEKRYYGRDELALLLQAAEEVKK